MPGRGGRRRGLAGLDRERALAATGPVAGVDEAGRGPLAGPVVAAAVILDLDRVPDGLADSKALSADTRERLFAAVLAGAEVGVAWLPHHEIDRVNIRQATLTAMARAVRALPRRPSTVLVDGVDPPSLDAAIRVEAVIGGDAEIASIAAASIVAKVMRDRMMRRLDPLHPGYGFARHVGYGTAAHRRALAELGPSPYHRRSFAPVRARDA